MTSNTNNTTEKKQKFRRVKILLTGGGTGGHIFPLIAIAEELKRQAPTQGIGLEIIFMGPPVKNKFWLGMLESAGIKIISVISGKLRRYSSFSNFSDLFFKVPLGTVQALWKVFWNMPDVIFSKGGYGSFPIVLAGSFYGVPIIIHESDSVAGLANKKLAHYAKIVAIGFKEVAGSFSKKKILITGNPIRTELATGSPEVARQFFRLNGKKPVILVNGGSQGAESINDLMLNNLELFLRQFEIIHITGNKKFEVLGEELKARFGHIDTGGYHPYPFLVNQLKDAYAVCDVIISRAGGSSIFEIAAVGKPSILIPLPNSAQDHQRINAYTYAQTGAAIIMEEPNLTPHLLIDRLKEILTDKELNKSMIMAAKKFATPQATKTLAEKILSFVK